MDDTYTDLEDENHLQCLDSGEVNQQEALTKVEKLTKQLANLPTVNVDTEQEIESFFNDDGGY